MEKVKKEIDTKFNDLEKKCDEGRQREMKGTLIVSSPERGHIRTEAVPRDLFWEQSNNFGPEAELDMVLRMVYEKTGVRIPWSDVIACHQISKKESHSYVLRIGNRQPFSGWDMLTSEMLTGKNFSRRNVFINFMLTSRRTELSKQVRQAKKDQLIHKYSIDQIGRISVKKIGNDDDVNSVNDIEKYSKKP